MSNAYPWATNKTKLQQAVNAVRTEGKEVNEENVKKNYIDRAGLLAEEAEAAKAVKRPRVTANGGRKVSVKEI